MTRPTPTTLRPAPARTALLIDLENILHLEEEPLPGHVRCCDDPAAHGAGLSVDAHRTFDQQVADNTWVCEPTAMRVLDEILALAGPTDYAVAAACTSLLCRIAFLADARGVGLRSVPSTPDAADTYLLDVAEHLASQGFTRFVIASGDRCFAEFASRHETVVVGRSTRSVSYELWLSAARVDLLSPRTAAAEQVPA